MGPALAPLALLAILLFSSAAGAQEALGFAEVRAAVSPGADGRLWQLVERVRPTLESELATRVKLVATIEAGLVQGRNPTVELERTLRASELGPLLDKAQCRWPQYENGPLRVDNADDYLDVDRLYLDLYAGAADLRLGRQALNWGSAQFFNPTDPLPEVLLAEPWRPRRGVNAARLNLPLGESRDLSAVVAINDSLDRLRVAARARQRWAGTDIALVGAWRGDAGNGLVGLDLRGTFGVGWWIEGAYFLGTGSHAEVAVGIDYSWPVLERLLLSAQYYRNGAGSTDPAIYRRAVTMPGVAGPVCGGGFLPAFGPGPRPDPFAPFTVARDYLLIGGLLSVLPELNTNVGFLQNLNDGSAALIPTVTYALLDWLDLAASAQVPLAVWGQGGELKPRPEDLQLQVPLPTGEVVTADLSGLVPAAVLTFWTRVSY